MGEANAKDIWKRLFNLLFNNKVPDEELPNMWAQFKAGNLHKSDIRRALESFKNHLHEDVRKQLSDIGSEGSADGVSSVLTSSRQYQLPKQVIDKLCDLSINESASEAGILYDLGRCSQLDDDFWRLLFTAIRDSAVEEISGEKTIPILEGGQTKHMTMAEIEQKFISENRDLLTAQRSVPDQMIHEDLIDAHFNTETLRESLKGSYDQKFSEAKKTLAEDDPRLAKNETELEKKAAAQAKKETKESREAKQLQHRVAMKAEDEVQKSILRAMKEFHIPVFVFRGVNTYKDIGMVLGDNLGFKMSKLKAFESGGSKSTLECEHDISALALPPSGPLVSFVQVTKS